jgi:hypothetical protein
VRIGKGHEAADAARHPKAGDRARAFVGRCRPADGADQRGDAGAAHANAEQDAAEHQVEAVAGCIHNVHARHGRKHTRHNDAAGAIAIRHHAGQHRTQTPRQIGNRHRGGERLATDAEFVRHGRQVKAHHLAQAHGNSANHAGRQDDNP